MKHSSISGIGAAGKKESPTAMVRLFVVGMALLLPGMAVQAIGEPIPGIDIVVKCLGCKPPFHGIPVPTGSGGTYQFKGLAAGNYDLSVGGKRVQTLRVGSGGSISGVLSREPDGKASITFNGQVGVVPDLPSAPVVGQPATFTATSPITVNPVNDPPGIAGGPYLEVELKEVLITGIKIADNESPRPTTRGTSVTVSGVDDNPADGAQSYKTIPGSKGGDKKLPSIGVTGVDDPSADGNQPYKIAPRPTGEDGKPGISDQAAAGGLISYGTAPPPKGAGEELPGLAGEPIPGVDVKLGKNPGGSIVVSAPTGSDGTYKFTGVAAGNYDLSVGGKRVQTLRVGSGGSISGVLSSEPGGKASITFNGQVGIVPDLPGAPVSTSRSNKKARQAKTSTTVTGVDDPAADGPHIAAPPPNNEVGKLQGLAGKPIKGGAPPPVVGPSTRAMGGEPNDVLMQVSTTRGTAPGPGGGDGKPALPGLAGATIQPTYLPDAPTRSEPPKGGDKKLPGIGVTGVDDKVADGNQPYKTAPRRAGGGVKLGTTVTGVDDTLPDGPQSYIAAPRQAGGGVKPGIAEANGALMDVSTTRGTAPRPDGVGGKLPGLAIQGEPIIKIPIGLEGDPEGIKVSTTTGQDGTFHFDKLPAGKYKLKIQGEPPILVSVGDDGIAGGTVMRGPDGSMSIFDRSGNRAATSPKGDRSKTAEKPVGFGSGNTMGAGPGGMGTGPMSPATMSPGAMSPGAMGGVMAPGGGGAMGPGRAMGGAGMGRP